MEESKAGPAICGRLKGPPFQFAMSLKRVRTDPNTGIERMVEAPELFAEPAIPGFALNGVDYPAQPPGSQVLVEAILREYTTNAQDLQWEVLSSFFELYRGQSKFADYVSLFDLALSDAETQCGLQMNAIAKTYFFLKGAQLTEKQHFDLRL
jgi:hypothetical protein